MTPTLTGAQDDRRTGRWALVFFGTGSSPPARACRRRAASPSYLGEKVAVERDRGRSPSEVSRGAVEWRSLCGDRISSERVPPGPPGDGLVRCGRRRQVRSPVAVHGVRWRGSVAAGPVKVSGSPVVRWSWAGVMVALAMEGGRRRPLLSCRCGPAGRLGGASEMDGARRALAGAGWRGWCRWRAAPARGSVPAGAGVLGSPGGTERAARRSAHQAGPASDEPATTRPGETSSSGARSPPAIPSGRATAEPPAVPTGPDPPR
jgi:hypothetical protein